MSTLPRVSSGVDGPAAVLRARWQALTPRERQLSSLAAAAVGILLVWWIAIAPALTTLARAEVRRTALEAQQQRMLALQAEAQRLQAQPRLGYDESLRALQTAVQQGLGGTAQLSVSGDRAIVTLRGTPAGTLASWLGQVRTNARAVPVEARLVRSPVRPAGAPAVPPGSRATIAALRPSSPAASDLSQSAPDVRWDGTLVLALPAR